MATECRDKLKKLLESGHESETRDQLMALAIDKRSCFEALMYFFLDNEVHWRYNQRASWPVSILAERKPEWLLPYMDAMIEAALEARHAAVRRNVVRLLQFMTIPQDYEGRIYDMCFQFLLDGSEMVAVRVFSMTVLAHIAVNYPDMIPELVTTIKSYYDTGSAAYKSRAKKLIKTLEKAIA